MILQSVSLEKSESLDHEYDESCSLRFQFFFLLHRLLFNFLYLLSSDESYFLDDEYDNDGSDSRFYGT